MTHNEIKKKVKQAIEEEKPLVLTTNNFLRNTEDRLFNFLRCYLEELDMFDCEELIIYAIRELAANANKANMKRLYFMDKNLDINNSDQYRQGMESFRDEAFIDLDKYTGRLQQMGIYVKFKFQVKKSQDLSIAIVNNTTLSIEEESRINDKIQKAWSFETMEDAMMHILDGTEGAGLGIVSIIMMLRNLGIDSKESLLIKKTPTETHSIMNINRGDLPSTLT